MHSTVLLSVNPQARPIRQDFFTVRALVRHLWWLLTLRQKAGKGAFRVRVVFPHATVPYWRARRALTGLWARRDPRYTVVVHSVDQGYGGPEEGGWWYQTRSVEHAVKVWRLRDVGPLMDALSEEWPNTGRSYSVLGGDDYRVRYYDRFTAVAPYESDYSPYC